MELLTGLKQPALSKSGREEYDTNLLEINYGANPFTFMFLQVDKCAGLIIGPVRSTLSSVRTLSYVLSRYAR